MEHPVIAEDHDDYLLVRLNRPEVRNAIDLATVTALHDVCAELERAPRPALLTGGDGIFAAGADINQLRERGYRDALSGINSSLFDRWARLPMPTIVLIDGGAIGGGAELAYACDFRIGTERTKIGNPETGLGIIAAAGGIWRLRELIDEQLAKEILLAGRILSATEALQAGLLLKIVTPEVLMDAGIELAARISRNAPDAVRLTKRLFHAPREAHPYIDDLAQAVLFETEEKHDRMTAFLERKKK
ncbi:enoyl-CoA hydratase/isomerase family protein [Microbacterium esteraromaticum]|uniref:enoyl-CoA hydratase/isomerase family protein n=1 Tax=Microbacterium esteraromaticum TaxID=57043 RepID=UPI001C9453D4|nr:enoyl-CoA hydratase/isomerase family protein [Microbacterium esteraromaticum]MBY6062403.1 enoyl-CoA hydratase/isomerase family protein [Microbacterium esteraromaticum]